MISAKHATMNNEKRSGPGAKWAGVTQWVQEHLRLLNWAVPMAMLLLVLGYELGPASWIYANLGYDRHLLAEILIFATLGPALAFVVLHLLRRWLEERDTSELQAALLARSRAEAEGSRQLNDDALQVLFAAGMLIDSLKVGNQALPPEQRAQVEETERALQDAVAQLRSHLLKQGH